MTINDMLEQVYGIQGEVKVMGIKDDCDHVYFEGLANWMTDLYGEPWADMDVTYIYVANGELVIEIEEE